MVGAPSYGLATVILSSLTETAPGAATTCFANSPAKCRSPVAGANGPLNLPVAGSIVGSAVKTLSCARVRPITLAVSTGRFGRFDASAAGVTALVVRADSMLEGPDWNELTSNAVTA